jgi:TrpR-related protein YerC/YecD
MKASSDMWDEQAEQFATALLSMSNEQDLKNFLGDVMTSGEIAECSARLQAAVMLTNKSTYTEVVATTKLSSRTVARISDWLKNGYGGYAKVISKLNSHHEHIPPASS